MNNEQIFKTIELDAGQILVSKETEMKNLGLRVFKSLLHSKLVNVNEKPLDVLKRLDQYVSPLDKELQEKSKVMIINSVIVRIFEKELSILEDERR
jgi:hypothetical protein